MNSINHPWGIGNKQRERYGNVWADLDFVFHEKISESLFKEDPMNTSIGHLELCNQKIKLRYKDLIQLNKSLNERLNVAKMERTTKEDVLNVSVKTYTFQLKFHELTKLIETIEEATESSMRAYQLGLYL